MKTNKTIKQCFTYSLLIIGSTLFTSVPLSAAEEVPLSAEEENKQIAAKMLTADEAREQLKIELYLSSEPLSDSDLLQKAADHYTSIIFSRDDYPISQDDLYEEEHARSLVIAGHMKSIMSTRKPEENKHLLNSMNIYAQVPFSMACPEFFETQE